MRKFITCPFKDKVDLDNPKTYSHLPKTAKNLTKLMLSEIGYYYCYVNFWHKERYKEDKQKERVEKLIQDFTDNHYANHKNVLWLQEQIFIFQDEIENMC
jgi:hypothetical protein